MINRRVEILSVLVAFMAMGPRAEAEEPERVRPSTRTVGDLRKASVDAIEALGEYLDAGHDWLHRRVQHWIEDVDLRFAPPEQAPIVVPLSPLRIGFDGAFVHRQGGLQFVATPDVEATVRLPNLEHRLKVFITNRDLQESPQISWLAVRIRRACGALGSRLRLAS